MSPTASKRCAKKRPAGEFSSWPIDDLRMLKTEPRVGEDGREHFVIFSKKLDAVTVVGPADLKKLRARGLKEISELPK